MTDSAMIIFLSFQLTILTELAKPETSRSYKSSANAQSILQNEEFHLRLAPPPIDQPDY